MTTEDGLPPTRQARAYIETLRTRLLWIESRLVVVPGSGAAVFYEAERDALAWALAVLEAEYDAIVRLHRDVIEPAADSSIAEWRNDRARLFGWATREVVLHRDEFPQGCDEVACVICDQSETAPTKQVVRYMVALIEDRELPIPPIKEQVEARAWLAQRGRDRKAAKAAGRID